MSDNNFGLLISTHNLSKTSYTRFNLKYFFLFELSKVLFVMASQALGQLNLNLQKYN